MLVTFQSDSYADITMFGDIAIHLLHLMGHSGTVPSAILADDVPAALERLKKAIEQAKAEESPSGSQGNDECDEKVSLAHRALPLIQLLEAAAADNTDVMWSS